MQTKRKANEELCEGPDKKRRKSFSLSSYLHGLEIDGRMKQYWLWISEQEKATVLVRRQTLRLPQLREQKQSAAWDAQAHPDSDYYDMADFEANLAWQSSVTNIAKAEKRLKSLALDLPGLVEDVRNDYQQILCSEIPDLPDDIHSLVSHYIL
jgi:hypothetical protein